MLSLVPLLIAAGILLAGNGLQMTLITLRASSEGMTPAMIGIMGTAYFGGFVLGTLAATRMIQAVGHIRVFSALAAIGSAAAVLMALYVDPYAWMAIRAVMGFCLSGLFTVIESWLNTMSSNEHRGKVFSAYSMVDLVTVTGSQFVLPAVGIEGFVAFALVAMLFSLSLVPVALSPTAQPRTDTNVRMGFWEVWRVSPLAFMACLTIGLTNSSFKTIGPLYARGIGLDFTQLAVFMSAGIAGGAFLQLPFGWLSDHFDRRSVLMIATGGAAVAGAMLSMATGSQVGVVYAGAFLFGAFAMPLYALAAAHANDFAKPTQYPAVSAGLLFTYAVGSMIGPLVASVCLQQFGPASLFAYTGVVHAVLILGALIRRAVRPTVPRQARVKHKPTLGTTPSLADALEAPVHAEGSSA